MKISIEEFNKLIPTICSKETSSNSELWTKQNPTHGHCAIVSVLAQECFGGEIVKVSLKDTLYENLKSHFFNVIDGNEIDFTISQFKGAIPYEDISREIKNRDEILSYPRTQERFDIFKSKLFI